MINWNIFKVKYDRCEQWAFEQLSYFLFCSEFNNEIGLFRYKNQKGLETEPLESNGEVIGFQAKYYQVPISKNKGDIKDSIKKAKENNPNLNKLFFYINKEFSESTKKNVKRPKYQKEIENFGKKLNVEVVWRVPSQFENQLALEKNRYLYNLFFKLEKSEGDLIDELRDHNETILKGINIDISFGNNKIKIDRSSIVGEIEQALDDKGNLVISGEGGLGKTAIFKEFYSLNSKNYPICIFRADELNVINIKDILKLDGDYTFTQFIEAYKDEKFKVFAIDSAEKLMEIGNKEVLNTLLVKLKENNWHLVFMTRDGYLEELLFSLEENHSLKFGRMEVSSVTANELEELATNFDFSLPKNSKLVERLRNLFYLNEYLRNYSSINQDINFDDFIEVLWKKRIQSDDHRNNLHLKREQCLIEIAMKRSSTGKYYINEEGLPEEALVKLRQDDILGYDEQHNGYFIVHDIYEEWALAKKILREFSNSDSLKLFIECLGESLPVRKVFRLWFSEKLDDSNEKIKEFIQEDLFDENIKEEWKDEILISVLQSGYTAKFFEDFKEKIIENDYELLKRILTLLKVSCVDRCVGNEHILISKGKGWRTVLEFICDQKEEFFENNINLILELFDLWTLSNTTGKTTRCIGLKLLGELSEEKEYVVCNISLKRNIFKLIYSTAYEMKPELESIFAKVIKNEEFQGKEIFKEFCGSLLVRPYWDIFAFDALFTSILSMCEFLWKKSNKELFYKEIEDDFGIVSDLEYNCFPASSDQTPIKLLLEINFCETLKFIVDFINYSVETYNKNGEKELKEVILKVDDKDIKQYSNIELWSLCNEEIYFDMPDLLKSIHLALQEFLFEYNRKITSEENVLKLKSKMISILKTSKSISLTSIVCNLVVSNPKRYHDIALILFKTEELLKMDSLRVSLLRNKDLLSLDDLYQQYKDGNMEGVNKNESTRLKKEGYEKEAYLKYFNLNKWSLDLFDENIKKLEDKSVYEKYSNPKLVLVELKNFLKEDKRLSEIKQIFKELSGNIASKLIIRHDDKLTQEEKLFCRQLILETLEKLFINCSYNNRNQQSVLYAIPTLIREYPDNIREYLFLIVYILFEANPIVLQEVRETIHKLNLRERNETLLKKIIYSYIKLKLTFEGPVDKKNVYESFLDINLEELPCDSLELNKLNFSNIQVIFLLIPATTKDEWYLNIYFELLSRITQEMMRNSSQLRLDGNLRYNSLNILIDISYFILQREEKEIHKYLSPFLENFSTCYYSKLFLETLISAENTLQTNKNFWYVWNKLYPVIKRESQKKRGHYFLRGMICNYLLVGYEGKIGAEGISFYTKVCREFGNIPIVLYSISKILNSSDCKFEEEGVKFVYDIVSRDKKLELEGLQQEIFEWLNNYIERYITKNRVKIKKDLRVKNRIIAILNFMIKRESNKAYIIRDNIT